MCNTVETFRTSFVMYKTKLFISSSSCMNIGIVANNFFVQAVKSIKKVAISKHDDKLGRSQTGGGGGRRGGGREIGEV